MKSSLTVIPARPVQNLKGRKRTKLSIFDEPELLQFFADNNIKESNVKLIYKSYIADPTCNLNDISGLSKRAAQLVPQYFDVFTTTVERRFDDEKSGTTKFLVRLQDGLMVESVIMRYNRDDPKKRFRASVCVSSQVGCNMGCTFCATGTMGLSGNLSCGEILEQLLRARLAEPAVCSVVFMGLGEPLDNYEAVVCAIRGMIDTHRFQLQRKHVSLSTVGLVPEMRKLLQDCPGIQIAVSLHAPNQELRRKIVPSAARFPITDILDALDAWTAVGKHWSMVEYVLLREVNDTPAIAHELGQLLQGRHVMLNVIPYNPTDVKEHFETPERERVEECMFSVALFYSNLGRRIQLIDRSVVARIVREHYQIFVSIRRTLGDDIEAACGQLVVQESSVQEVRKKRKQQRDEAQKAADAVSHAASERIHDVEESWTATKLITAGVALTLSFFIAKRIVRALR